MITYERNGVRRSENIGNKKMDSQENRKHQERERDHRGRGICTCQDAKRSFFGKTAFLDAFKHRSKTLTKQANYIMTRVSTFATAS